VTAEERELSRPDWQVELPLLLPRAQAQLCQVSEEILDLRARLPVIRRNGGHFVRIHRTALERWLEQFALASNPHRCAATTCRRGLDECCRRPIGDRATAARI
jgi:hypothetical protein